MAAPGIARGRCVRPFTDLKTKWAIGGTVFRYSMRAMTGYLGPVLRLRRESDNVEADAYPDGTASAGVLVGDARQTVAAWSGGGAVRVSRWYNQGGVGAIGDLFTVPSTTLPYYWTTPITADIQPTFVNCPTFGAVGNLLFQAGIGPNQEVILNEDFTIHFWCKSTVPMAQGFYRTVLLLGWNNGIWNTALPQRSGTAEPWR